MLVTGCLAAAAGVTGGCAGADEASSGGFPASVPLVLLGLLGITLKLLIAVLRMTWN